MSKPGKHKERRRRVGVAAAAVVALAAVVAAALAVSGGDAVSEQSTVVADGSAAPTESGDAGQTGTTDAGSTSASVTTATSIPEASSEAPPTEVSEPAPGAPVATDAEPVTAGGVVDVVVSWSGWVDPQVGVEVDGYVSGVVESGGTCTLTLSRAGSSLTATSAAEPDASTTSCAPLFVASPELTAGSWAAVLSYGSPSSNGSSAPVSIEVPVR